MAIIIQKVLKAVNVIDTKNEATKNIVASYPLNCICSQDQLGKNIVFVGGAYPGRKEFEFYDIRYQDFVGQVETWTGSIVDFVNKINGEYFGFTIPLPTGAATAANQVLEIAATKALTKPTDSQYSSSRDVLEEIQITGQFRGKTAYAFNVIGQRNGFTSTSILQGLKEYNNGVADFAVTSNSTLDIKSSSASDAAAGTGCRTVKVTYINNSNNLVESAAIALNGLTNVVGVLTGVNQVLWMETATAGSGGVAAGNVILSITGGGAAVGQITAGGNKSRSAIFMIPQGYTGYIKDWQVSAINNDQDCRLRGTVNSLDRSLATVYHYMSEKYAAANISISPSNLWLKLPALSRVKVSTMSGGTAATVRCNTNFLIILIAD